MAVYWYNDLWQSKALTIMAVYCYINELWQWKALTIMTVY